MKFKVLDLFSGIGGFSLGLERTGGFETVAFCEIEEFPRKVLNKHWPDVPIYEDVRNVTAERLRADGIIPDIITGGFPCQDISVAGNQAGIGEGTRSGLWSECARLLGDIRPRYAIFENVTALLSGDNGRWFEQVLWDISQVGYDAEWHCISASELGAYHHRDRVWIICYPKHNGQPTSEIRESHQKGNGSNQKGAKPAGKFARSGDTENVAHPKSELWDVNENERDPEISRQELRSKQLGGRGMQGANKENASNSKSERSQRGEEPRIFREGRKGWLELTSRQFCGFDGISEIEPTICGGSNGLPNYAHRLKGLGNAVVPPIPQLLGHAILEAEKCN